MAEFTADTQHVAGQENMAADALSIPLVAALGPSSTISAVASDLHGISAH
jgi:hypothetical protein